MRHKATDSTTTLFDDNSNVEKLICTHHNVRVHDNTVSKKLSKKPICTIEFFLNTKYTRITSQKNCILCFLESGEQFTRCFHQAEAASTFALDDFKTSVDQLQQIEFYFSVHCMEQRNKRRCVRSLTDQRKWRQNEVRTSMVQADHQTLTSFAIFQ